MGEVEMRLRLMRLAEARGRLERHCRVAEGWRRPLFEAGLVELDKAMVEAGRELANCVRCRGG